MKYFPVFWNLNGKQVLVIGGGEIAGRRVRALLECGAEVRVIATDPSEAIESLSDSGKIHLDRRPYLSGDLKHAHAVLTATDNAEVNEAAWREAVSSQIPINVADDPEKCDFILPALFESGDLTIAVSTNGRSPALAARIRSRLGAMIGTEYGEFLDMLDAVRSSLKQSDLTAKERRRILYDIVDSDVLGLIRRGEGETVASRIEDIVYRRSDDSEAKAAGGIVYIVGAGPGDPGLITARGLECLRVSDVVLHDRLISPRLLEESRAGATIIDVGKQAGDRGKMQSFIDETMVERARRGQTVCRLKGGDPFVFGRGGEEARALTEADIAFQIVPGVTSAVAVPGAVGIPVTHRGIAHSFMVMTGSRAEEASSEEWAGACSVIEGGGTLVVMMGLRWLGVIVGRLRDAGCPAGTPAAVISNGTWETQRVSVGTLADIHERSAGLASPAVIVFGRVVAERQRLLELGVALEPRS